jgi:hypothetical protein
MLSLILNIAARIGTGAGALWKWIGPSMLTILGMAALTPVVAQVSTGMLANYLIRAANEHDAAVSLMAGGAADNISGGASVAASILAKVNYFAPVDEFFVMVAAYFSLQLVCMGWRIAWRAWNTYCLAMSVAKPK